MASIERKDWALIVIAEARCRHMSPVQLQKALFLLSMEAKEDVGDDFYDFKPYDYGPYDSDVSTDAELLVEEGLLTSKRHRWTEFAATLDGVEKANKLKMSLESKAAAYVTEVVAWVCSLSFTQLVSAIYKKYPAMKENSVFSD